MLSVHGCVTSTFIVNRPAPPNTHIYAFGMNAKPQMASNNRATMTRQEIAQAANEARIAQGITYRQLASLSGRDTRAVQAVLKGNYSYGIDTLLDVIRALKLDISLTKV